MSENDVVKLEVVKAQDSVDKAREQGEDYLAAFEDFEIETPEDYEVASDCLKDVKKVAKQIKAEKELATKPMNTALRQVRSWFAPAEKALADTEKLLKTKIADWTLLQEQRNREAMQKAAAASQAGNFDEAHEAAKQITDRPKAKGITVSQPGWDYILEDLSKVPREFLALDHSAVKIHLKNAGAEKPTPIPGVKFVPSTPTVIVRTG
jgi:hypothetical protein